MTKVLISALAVVLPVLAFTTPSYATKGIDAARSCEANPNCKTQYGDEGQVTIYIDGKVIYCDGPQAECIIVRKVPVGGVFNPAIRNSGKEVDREVPARSGVFNPAIRNSGKSVLLGN